MAPITGSVTSTCKPTSTNSPSASTGGSIRSTPSVHCSASRAALPHRPMQSFTPVPGSTLHLGGVGKNRIGKAQRFSLDKLHYFGFVLPHEHLYVVLLSLTIERVHRRM